MCSYKLQLMIHLILILLLAKNSEAECEAGWSKFQCHCYRWVDSPSSFDQAREACQAMSSSIVSIHSQAEDAFVKGLVNQNGGQTTYIGLYDDREKQGLQWVDGSTLDFINWRHDQPNNAGGFPEDCAALWETRTNGWTDVRCIWEFNFICKKPEAECESGWSKFQCHCYRWVSSPSTFAQARESCEDMSSSVVSIHSQAEDAFVEGLVNQNGGQTTYIGLYDDRGNHGLQWIDGSPLDFINWRHDQPNNAGGFPEDCAALWKTRTNGWTDVRCSWEFNFICKRPVAGGTTGRQDTGAFISVDKGDIVDNIITALEVIQENLKALSGALKNNNDTQTSVL